MFTFDKQTNFDLFDIIPHSFSSATYGTHAGVSGFQEHFNLS